jgi:hypothetical protein
VPVLVAVTLALGIAAPEESATVPKMVEVATWEKAVREERRRRADKHTIFFMDRPLCWEGLYHRISRGREGGSDGS